MLQRVPKGAISFCSIDAFRIPRSWTHPGGGRLRSRRRSRSAATIVPIGRDDTGAEVLHHGNVTSISDPTYDLARSGLNTHSEVLEQARTEVESSVGTTGARILDDRLGRLASVTNGDSLSTFRGRVTVPKLGSVESDGPSAVLVQVSACTESDRGVVVGHTDPGVTLLILMSCRDGKGQGGGSERS